MTVAHITEMIQRDKQAAIPIGAYKAEYGVTLSLPTVVGRFGVTRVLGPGLTEEKRKALAASADMLRRTAAQLGP